MNTILILLRIVHIVSGAIWVGASILLIGFVEPTASASGQTGSQFMQRLGSRMGIFITIVAVLTVLGGFALYGMLGYRLNTTAGATFLVGGLIALVSLVVGGAITGPTTARLGRLGAEIQSGGKPPTTEQMAQLQALQGRLRMGGRVNVVLVLIAITLMAVARYL